MNSKMFPGNFPLPSNSTNDGKQNRLARAQLNSEREGVLSTAWYWSNYIKSIMWQSKHKVSLWKAYAANLENDRNRIMRELNKLKNIHSNCNAGASQDQTSSMQSNEAGMVQSQQNNDEEIQFEMSEEMIKFIEQSIKRKMEMQKAKEREINEFRKNIKELQQAHKARENEMKLLYGEGCPMVVGMETAVQLSYEKFCDLKSPKFWPNIPLNL